MRYIRDIYMDDESLAIAMEINGKKIFCTECMADLNRKLKSNIVVLAAYRLPPEIAKRFVSDLCAEVFRPMETGRGWGIPVKLKEGWELMVEEF